MTDLSKILLISLILPTTGVIAMDGLSLQGLSYNELAKMRKCLSQAIDLDTKHQGSSYYVSTNGDKVIQIFPGNGMTGVTAPEQAPNESQKAKINIGDFRRMGVCVSHTSERFKKLRIFSTIPDSDETHLGIIVTMMRMVGPMARAQRAAETN